MNHRFPKRDWTSLESADACRSFLAGENWADIGQRMRRTPDAIRSHVLRQLTDEQKLQRPIHERMIEGARRGHDSMRRRTEGWPVLEGSDEDREDAFVRTVVREAVRCGLLRIAA